MKLRILYIIILTCSIFKINAQVTNGQINWKAKLQATQYTGANDGYVIGDNNNQDEPTFLYHARDNTQPIETNIAGEDFFTRSCTTYIDEPIPGVDLCVFWDRYTDADYGPTNNTYPGYEDPGPYGFAAFASVTGAPGTTVDSNLNVIVSEIKLGVRIFEDDGFDAIFGGAAAPPFRCDCNGNLNRGSGPDDPLINKMMTFMVDGLNADKVQTWVVDQAGVPASTTLDLVYDFVHGNEKTDPLIFGELTYDAPKTHTNTTFYIDPYGCGGLECFEGYPVWYSFTVPSDGASVDIDINTVMGSSLYTELYRSGPSSGSLLAVTTFGMSDLPPISLCRKHAGDTDGTDFTTYYIKIGSDVKDAFTLSITATPTADCLDNTENEFSNNNYDIEFGLPDRTSCATGLNSYQTYSDLNTVDFEALIQNTIDQNFHVLEKGQESINGLFVGFKPSVVNLEKSVRIYHYRQELGATLASDDLVLVLLEEHLIPPGEQVFASNYTINPPSGSAGDAIVFEIFTSTGNNRTVIAAPLLVTGIDITSGIIGETVKPDQVDLILYDPPGDQSVAEFTENYSVCRTVERSFARGTGNSRDVQVKFGVKGKVGFIFELDFELSTSFNQDIEYTRDTTTTNAYKECTSISSNYSTSNGVFGIGGAADVFIGSGEQWEWGFQDSISLDPNCSIKIDTSFIATVVGATQFVWDRKRIDDEIIELQDSIAHFQVLIDGNPNLSDDIRLDKARKEEQVRLWNEILTEYNIKKADVNDEAGTFNWSFGGGNLSKEIETQVSTARSTSVNLIFKQSTGQDFTATLGASGIEGGYRALMNNSLSASVTNEDMTTRTVKYTYGDGNVGDIHIGKISFDNDYGTHIFHLDNTSKTSCPYEGGTRRDMPSISGSFCSREGPYLDNVYVDNVGLMDEAKVFIKVCNQSNEPRLVSWRLDANYNSVGYQFNGSDNQIDDLGILAPGQCDTIDLILNKINNTTVYNNLVFRLFPTCLKELESYLLSESDMVQINITFGGDGDYPNGDRDCDGILNMDECPSLLVLDPDSGPLTGTYQASTRITVMPNTTFPAGRNITLNAPIVDVLTDVAIPKTTVLSIDKQGCP